MQCHDFRIADRPRRTPGPFGLVLATLVLASCATGPGADAPPVDAPPPTQEPIVLSSDGKRYLRNMFIYACAREYVPYGEGEGPPRPSRTDAERASREQELQRCKADVAAQYTQLETVRRMTWTGKEHAMGDGEMQGIVRDGAAYLDDYVGQLVIAERSREGTLPPQSQVAESEIEAAPETP